ncbi:hypothetical protein HBH50_182990 [Parastagonospora nodorum]|nr:hypothetical protein HBH50_182990 [Parastagonospora nodorum]
MDPPSNTGKRRKLSLFNTIRVLNGGSDDDLVTPFNTPLEIVEDGGSDTEDEEDEQTAQYYLNKMRDDTDRPKQTVFGEGVEVWKSYGGTIYADLTDQVKRKMREEETWNAEAMATVAGGLKRKMGEEADAKIKNWMLEKKTDGKPIPPDVSPPPPPHSPPPPPPPKINDLVFWRCRVAPIETLHRSFISQPHKHGMIKTRHSYTETFPGSQGSCFSFESYGRSSSNEGSSTPARAQRAITC